MLNQERAQTFSETSFPKPGSFFYNFTDSSALVSPRIPSFLLLSVKKGVFSCSLSSSKLSISAKEGDLILFSPGALPLIVEGTEYHALFFPAQILQSSLCDDADVNCLSPLSDSAHSWHFIISSGSDAYYEYMEIADKLYSLRNTVDAVSSLQIRSLLLHFFVLLLNDSLFSAIRESHLAPVLPDEIQTVLSYIDSHFTEPIRIRDLAALCYLSETYLIDFFHQQTGTTLVEYITKARIREACRLLTFTDLSITEIAYGSGFRNLSNFNRYFKKATGVTPSSYRKQSHHSK